MISYYQIAIVVMVVNHISFILSPQRQRRKYKVSSSRDISSHFANCLKFRLKYNYYSVSSSDIDISSLCKVFFMALLKFQGLSSRECKMNLVNIRC